MINSALMGHQTRHSQAVFGNIIILGVLSLEFLTSPDVYRRSILRLISHDALKQAASNLLMQHSARQLLPDAMILLRQHA